MAFLKQYKYQFSIILIVLMWLGVAYINRDIFVRLWFKQQYITFNNKSVKVLLVHGNGQGEREQVHRFRIAAKRLGLNLKVVSAALIKNDQYRCVANKELVAIGIMRPDLILTIERNIPVLPGAPNYLVLDQSKKKYLAKTINNNYTFIHPQHYNFTALLPTFPEIDLLQTVYEEHGNKFYGFRWYPTMYKTNYKPRTPKRLFYPGGTLTDATRSSDKYKKMFAMLDKQGYLDVYGPKDVWAHTPNSLHPPIPFDGISLIKINNKAGITLLLHAKDHFNGAVPTGRIFEATAANTVIISDRNPFIQQNFGDNVLYIDVEQSPENMFQQIDQHMQWIFAHPKQAKQMAQRCHDIFVEKFTLEAQLQQLLALHATIRSK